MGTWLGSAKRRRQCIETSWREGPSEAAPAPPCLCGKRAYTSPRAVKDAHRKFSDRIRVYWCAQGGCWHLTSAALDRDLAPKAAPGPRRKRKAREAAAKLTSKRRDHWQCRVPGCPVQGVGEVESAHLRPAGMGGNPDGSRGWLPRDYVTLCRDHHRQLDGHRIEALVGSAGGDGDVGFREVRHGVAAVSQGRPDVQPLPHGDCDRRGVLGGRQNPGGVV